MSRKKRPQIVEYNPSTPSLFTTGTITSQHTHYEPRRPPVKSTVTVSSENANIVSDMPPDGRTSLIATFLDDDKMEQVECEGQELEARGFPIHHDAEMGLSVEGARKRRRTQAVGNRFSLRRPKLTFL